MTENVAYRFEELSDDMPRPPLAAQRALLHAGILASPRGWVALQIEVRVAIAREGLQGLVDVKAVRALAEHIPPKLLKLVPKTADPNPDQIPPGVGRALGPARPLTDAEWRTLRAVDRSVLVSLSANARLLSRAYDELAAALGKSGSALAVRWVGALAHCEVRMNPRALHELMDPDFLGGRALVLARVAGIRAARRVAETFDLHAESAPGPVELDWHASPKGDQILWQGHVSTWEGAFFPAASLLAATTAAAALIDMVRTSDPSAHLANASIREEDWLVGSASASRDEATAMYSASALQDLEGDGAQPDLGRTFLMAPNELPNAGLEEAAKVPLARLREAPVAQQHPDAAPFSAPPSSRGTPLALATADLRSPMPTPATPKRPAKGTVPGFAIALFALAMVIFVVSICILGYVLVHQS